MADAEKKGKAVDEDSNDSSTMGTIGYVKSSPKITKKRTSGSASSSPKKNTRMLIGDTDVAKERTIDSAEIPKENMRILIGGTKLAKEKISSTTSAGSSSSKKTPASDYMGILYCHTLDLVAGEDIITALHEQSKFGPTISLKSVTGTISEAIDHNDDAVDGFKEIKGPFEIFALNGSCFDDGHLDRDKVALSVFLNDKYDEPFGHIAQSLRTKIPGQMIVATAEHIVPEIRQVKGPKEKKNCGKFYAHTINVKAGEDVLAAIYQFSRSSDLPSCVMSVASNAYAAEAVFETATGPSTIKGELYIYSLNGSYAVADDRQSLVCTVSMVDATTGRFYGIAAKSLVAATHFQIIMANFKENDDDEEPKKYKEFTPHVLKVNDGQNVTESIYGLYKECKDQNRSLIIFSAKGCASKFIKYPEVGRTILFNLGPYTIDSLFALRFDNNDNRFRRTSSGIFFDKNQKVFGINGVLDLIAYGEVQIVAASFEVD